MSFVKDDHGYTRGVGAVASMDAVSSARRQAEARRAIEMARRDAIMARHTLGAPIETGQEAAFSRPSPTRPGLIGKGRLPVRPFPPPKPLPPKPLPPRFPFRPRGDVSSAIKDGMMVKSPGSVIDQSPPVKDPAKGTAVSSITSTPPTKGAVTIVAGGSGTSWTSGGGGKTSSAPVDMLPEMPEMPPDDAPAAAAPAAPAAKPKTSGNLLLYAALGIGAYWLLTRSK